jgi:hypothetical protein
MRALLAIYLLIGILLGAIGHLFTGACPDRNTDIAEHVIFVLTWPVGLYHEVYEGRRTAEAWVHDQACEGGGPLGKKKAPD